MHQIGMTTHFLLAFFHNIDTPHLYYEEISHVCCHPLWIIVHPEPFKLELAIQMFTSKYRVAETCHFQLLKAEVTLSINRSIKNNHTFFETVNCLNIKSNNFYLYTPKSPSHHTRLNGLYNLYIEQHSLSLDPRFK